MISSILLFTVLGAGHYLSGGPFVVHAERIKEGVWQVPLEISGKRQMFLLNDDVQESLVDSSLVQATGIDPTNELALSYQNNPMAKLRFQLNEELPEKGGMLGLDVLQHFAVGFDLETSEVTFWPDGMPSEAEAKAWVQGGTRRPGAIGDATPWSADLVENDDGFPCVSGTIGGKPSLFRVQTFSDDAYIPPSEANLPGSIELLKSDAGQRLMQTSKISLGAIGPFFTYVSGIGPFDTLSPNTASVGLDYLNSKRVILDLVNRKIYEQVLDEQSRSAMVLSRTLRIPLHVTNGVLRYGPKSETSWFRGHADGLQDDDEIVSIKGVEAKVFSDLISKKGFVNPSDLQQLFKLVHGKPFTVTVNRNGKKYDAAIKID